eukprot:TRINITY_DN20649_c0_g1_i1.p2 TRINITY_DN20649_c0_g1~~TRINITY_DN20649_c0_g1_i1.p2  ORF type:complete len:500 (-),score=193.38 TRINITY_DN20649_c0_g1_i1:135-1634(-)
MASTSSKMDVEGAEDKKKEDKVVAAVAEEEEHKSKEELEREKLMKDMRANVALCERASEKNEIRYLARVVRKIPSVRRRLTPALLSVLVKTHLPVAKQAALLKALERDEKVDEKPPTKVCGAVEAYLTLLTIISCVDRDANDTAFALSTALIARFHEDEMNRRNLDPVLAKAYFYYARCAELCDSFGDIRPELLHAYRTASLRHDIETQATLLNALLRNYLTYNLYDQAEKLVNKTAFPVDRASSNQHARFLYYTGRIEAIKLDYTRSYESLTQALRKAPQHSAEGFRVTVSKLSCIVQLLLGDIPDRSLFSQADFAVALKPYYELTEAVRVGDLAAFHQVLKKREHVFRLDKTLSLIQRLRRNVIKTGLRKINEAYSRISLADVCEKLHFDNIEDAEFIVAKAIRDGVIDASIDHDQQILISNEVVDIYSTNEPQDIFHQRIKFCLNLHNEAVMAMRFPEDTSKQDEEERKERLKQEEELAQELAEEDDEDEMDDVGL